MPVLVIFYKSHSRYTAKTHARRNLCTWICCYDAFLLPERQQFPGMSNTTNTVEFRIVQPSNEIQDAINDKEQDLKRLLSICRNS